MQKKLAYERRDNSISAWYDGYFIYFYGMVFFGVYVMNDTAITIDLKPMSMIVEEGGRFLFDPRAEDALQKWLDFLQRVEETKERVKEHLGEEMRKKKIIKIEGQNVKVSRRYFGERYEITDRNLALAQGFAKEVTKTNADGKAIEEYAKTTGELPEGVKLRERTESVVIQEAKGGYEPKE